MLATMLSSYYRSTGYVGYRRYVLNKRWVLVGMLLARQLSVTGLSLPGCVYTQVFTMHIHHVESKCCTVTFPPTFS